MSDAVAAPLLVTTTVFVPPQVSSVIVPVSPGGVSRGEVMSDTLSDAVRHASLAEQP